MRRKIKPGPAKYFQNSLSIHQLMLGLFSGCGEPYDTRPPPDDGIDADVSIRQVPWLVSLGGFKTRTKWDHQCGGSLVTNKHVLTAAHWWVSSTSFGFPFRLPVLKSVNL